MTIKTRIELLKEKSEISNKEVLETLQNMNKKLNGKDGLLKDTPDMDRFPIEDNMMYLMAIFSYKVALDELLDEEGQ